MVGPLTKMPSGPISPVQARSSLDGNDYPSSNGNEPGWFLPSTDANPRGIDANPDSDLQGSSPDSIATHILSHIGA